MDLVLPCLNAAATRAARLLATIADVSQGAKAPWLLPGDAERQRLPSTVRGAGQIERIEVSGETVELVQARVELGAADLSQSHHR